MQNNSKNESIDIAENERIDDLQLNGLKIIQKVDGYTFTSDSVLLANFVKAKKTDNLLEIGAGTGIISILVNEKQRPKTITAVEIQKYYAELIARNLKLNKIDNISVICDSIQNYAKSFTSKQFDVVYSNPPYFPYKGSTTSSLIEREIARFDKFLPLDELIYSVNKLLKFGGKFYFIYSADKLQKIISIVSKHNFALKKCCFIYPNSSKNANTILCEAIKGGKSGLTILPPVFTNNLDGNYVETLQKLFGSAKN